MKPPTTRAGRSARRGQVMSADKMWVPTDAVAAILQHFDTTTAHLAPELHNAIARFRDAMDDRNQVQAYLKRLEGGW